MGKITPRSSFETEKLEEKFQARNHFLGALTYDPRTDKIYMGDGREYLEKNSWLVDVGKYNKAKVLGAAGKVDEADKVKGVFSDLYHQIYGNYKKILKIQENVYKPYHAIGDHILGAAGPTATTDYETIRREGDLLGLVSSEMHTNEDYQAINIANRHDRDSVKFEYLKRTTAKIKAQSNLGDEDEAASVKHAYSKGTKELFAYGVQWTVSMRDKIDTKIDITRDFLADLPGMFLQAKNDDVVTLLNAITGNNQGDWDAFTGGIADVYAAAQVQTAEDAVKKFGRPLVAVMASDSWRGYMKNLQGAHVPNVESNVANRSTSSAPAKTGELPGNPGIRFYIDDGLTAGSYVLAAQRAYMQYFQAMTIQTSYKNPRNPGQTEQRFWYEFAGFEETNTSAQYKGTTVLA